MPICAEGSASRATLVEQQAKGEGKRDNKEQRFTHSCHVVDNTVDDLALERLEHDRATARDELGLAVARDDHADVRDGEDGDDEAELASEY